MNNILNDPFEPKDRDKQNSQLREYIESTDSIDLSDDSSQVMDFAFHLAEINFPINREKVTPKEVRDGMSDGIKSIPLFSEELNMRIIKDKCSVLYDTLKPQSPEEKAIFYFLFLAKGHFFPDSNGRISRIVSGIFLGLEKNTLKRLVSKNYEIREWIMNLEGDDLNEPLARFRKLYESATTDNNKREFIRIIKGELPENLKNFKFERKKR